MAKTSILTIMIQLAKQGNADRETIKGLAQLKSNVTQVMGTLAAFAGTAYAVDKAFEATVGTFVSYAAQVRELQRLTGATAEDTSRLIQAADDVTISYESLQKALWFAAKNGVEVNIESIARLADEYSALEGPTERAEFLAKKFGKGGAEMGKLLEQGSSGVRRLTDATADGLVLTEAAIKAAREYEIQTDNLNDAWTAFKVNIGQGVIPVVNQLLVGLNNTNAIRDEANRLMKEGTAHNREEALSMAVTNLKLKEQAQGFDALAQSSGAAVDDLDNAAAAEERFKAQITQLGEFIQGDLGKAWDDYNTKIAEYKEQLAAAKKEEDKREIQGKIDAETAAYNERATAIMFNIQQRQILAAVEADPTKAAEAVAIQTQLAESYGLIDERQKQAILNAGGLVDMWARGGLAAENLTAALQRQTDGFLSTSGAAQNEADNIYHAGQRALDAIGKFEAMNEAQAGLGEGIRSNAGPAVAALKRDLGGLPPSGTAWSYLFDITVHGSVPNLSGSRVKAPVNQRPGQQQVAQMMASGGQMGAGWTMVGEEGFELISPSGYVFTNAQARALLASGMVPESKRMFGGETGGGRTVTHRSVAPGHDKPQAYRSRGEAPPPSSMSSVDNVSSSSAVASVVEPLAASTEAAIQSATSAQQQQVAEGIQTRNVIDRGNNELSDKLSETNDLLRNLNNSLPRSIAAAFQQANP